MCKSVHVSSHVPPEQSKPSGWQAHTRLSLTATEQPRPVSQFRKLASHRLFQALTGPWTDDDLTLSLQ